MIENKFEIGFIVVLVGISIYLYATGTPLLPEAVTNHYKDINTSSLGYSLGFRTLDERNACYNITKPIDRMNCLGFVEAK